MSEKENLFEGITILSPQEIENNLTGNSNEESEGENNKEVDNGVLNNNLTIEPVTNKEVEESSSSNEPVSDSMYSAIIKDLMKDGVINNEEDEEKLTELLKDASADTIKKLMASTIDKNIEEKQKNWKSGFSGAKKRFLEIEDAFTNADNAVQTAQQLEFFDTLTEDTISGDTNLQQNIYFDYLKSKNFSDNDAIEAVQEAVSLGNVRDKALKYAPVLKQDLTNRVEHTRAQNNANIEHEQAKNQEMFNTLLNTIDEKDSFVDGLSINKIGKEKLKNNITNTVYTDDSGKAYTSLMYKQMKNPSEFEMLINYYDSIGLFDSTKEGTFKPNISKLKNVAKTKAVSEMDKVIAANNERGVGRAATEGSERTKSILDMLENASKNK